MPARDLERAREAFAHRDAHGSRLAHDARAEERHRAASGRYLKSIVYGGLDGIITTFAVVAGVAGAALSSGIVLILGFANLIADGLSMAIGDYLSTKAENDYAKAEREREEWEVEHYPDGEKKELVEVYVEKGLPEADARAVVDLIARYKRAWIDVMMVEELGIVGAGESPLGNALATFVSFGAFGFVPLTPYVISLLAGASGSRVFPVASALTALTLFALGALKVWVTGRNWLRSGAEALLVGGIAAAAAFAVGRLLSGLA